MTDEEIRNRILDVAADRFFRYGYSKVTMSEIADGLGMSKRTVYAHFPGKGDILGSIVDRLQQSFEQRVSALRETDRSDVRRRLENVLQEGARIFSRFSQAFLADIRRNAPDAWKKFEGFRNERMNTIIVAILNDGRDTGYFRRDIHPVLIMLIHQAATESLARAELLAVLPLSTADMNAAVLKIIFEGILTDGARRRPEPEEDTLRQEDTVYV